MICVAPDELVTEGLNDFALRGVTGDGGALFGLGFEPLEGVVSEKIGRAGLVGFGQLQIAGPGVGAFPVRLVNRAGLLGGGVQAEDIRGVAKTIPLIDDEARIRGRQDLKISQEAGGSVLPEEYGAAFEAKN